MQTPSRWTKAFREKLTLWTQSRFGSEATPTIHLVFIVPALVFVLQILGAWEIWTYTSAEAVILGRYSPAYFYPALAYHLLWFGWTGFVIWNVLAVREGDAGLFDQIVRKHKIFILLFWGLLYILWGGWIAFLVLFTTKITFMQAFAITATLFSVSLWIFNLDWQYEDVPRIRFRRIFDFLMAQEIGASLVLPARLPVLRILVLVVFTSLTWITALGGGFLAQDYASTALIIFMLCIIPGWMLCLAVKENHSFPLPGKVALWFTLGVAMLEIVAGLGRLFQLHVQYTILGVAIIESVLLAYVVFRDKDGIQMMERKVIRLRITPATLFLMIASIAGVIWIFSVSDQLAMFRYAPTRDTWNYSRTTLWLLQHPADPLSPRRILGTLNPRMFTNGWLFLNSVLSWAQPIQPAQLISVNLTPLLTIVGFTAIYFFAHVISDGKRRVAYLSVAITVLVHCLGLILSRPHRITHRGLPEVFMIRIADDKIVAFLILLPIVLALAYRYLVGGTKGHLFLLVIALFGLTLTHPMGIAGFGMCAGGFGAFHILVSRRSMNLRRWILLGGIGISLLLFAYILDSGALLKPSIQDTIQASTRNAAITKTKLVEGVSLEDFLFDEPQQKSIFTDWTLPTFFLENKYTPLLQVSVAVALFLMLVSYRNPSTQLLSGITIFTISLLYIPGVDTVFSTFVSREFSWRFLFQIPLGTLLAMGAYVIVDGIMRKIPQPSQKLQLPNFISFVFLILLLSFMYKSSGYIEGKRAYYANDQPSSEAWDVLERLDRVSDGEALIMAPRHLNPMIMGFGKGRVFYTKGADLSEAGVEWLNRFFDVSSQTIAIEDQAYMYLLLDEFDFDILIMPRGHVLNEGLFFPSQTFQLVEENEGYLIFEIRAAVCWPMDESECGVSVQGEG